MTISNIQIIILFVIANFICIAFSDKPVALAEDKAAKNYYTDTKKGWWWYEKEPEKPKEKKDKKDDKRQEQTQQQRKLPSLKEYTNRQLWHMHSDEFKELWNQFLKKAETGKTVEDVREFWTVNDIARRRALTFTNLTGYVMQKYPELSVSKDYPHAVPGMNALTKQRLEEIEKTLRQSHNEFGLLYFYSPDCSYCVEQDGILYFFNRKYGWDIKKVDINRETSLAGRFGATTTPYIVLVYIHSRDYLPVSAGVVAMSELEEKIYRGMRLLKGEITPQEYTIYEFQRGGSFDIEAPFKEETGIEDKQ